eukprot:CAMPEP_0113377806 /NCGR_PEP_ID=MMETSP0013_2-20120614/3361_1 /TAXON_ID=2843 ORGANISM="Skeletonema costatum, Strain 1716" /NCGR_SAMPLE_ID=MMETSP0013_2 /ASSEMBLY_ACC=CAM_ASM_000158 /LENGTH=545 /DNA_ID=CAMNT_0000259983 /DNA_START=82 /DNA_END=1715 /DNA_ORIENTATION=+ /assembly_acc=CAM_ASM_000158
MGICSCANDCITQPQLKLETAIQNIQSCHNAAKQTITLCTSTISTGDKLVTTGESIKDSLIGAVTDLDAESFAIIADLMDGDMAHEAKHLAGSMREHSNKCMELSMTMVKSLEESVDALPDSIESYIEKKAQQSITDELSTEERGLASNIEEDVKELTSCIDAIDNLKLLTAIQSGSNAFVAIASKSEICRKIFGIIRKFATSITTITEAILALDVSAVISKVKDILTAIGLCRYIKQFAEGCKGLMEKIVTLFEGAADKLSLLWKALSSAKDKMAESLKDVIDAQSLCEKAGEKMKQLRRSTDGMDRQLNPESPLTLLKSFNQTRFGDSINVTREIDDEMVAAKSKMENAANMIYQEYKSLPPMITDGISDTVDDDDDVQLAKTSIATMESELDDMEKSIDTINSADSLQAGKVLYNEVSNLPQKIDACQDMIDVCRDCASKGQLSIDSFLGKWSLETAVSQIQQMCRLVSTSSFMKEVVVHIQRILLVMSRLLKELKKRVQSAANQAQQFLSESGVESKVESMIDSAGDAVADKLDSMMGKFL